jgi:hypothetical protein
LTCKLIRLARFRLLGYKLDCFSLYMNILLPHKLHKAPNMDNEGYCEQVVDVNCLKEYMHSSFGITVLNRAGHLQSKCFLTTLLVFTITEEYIQEDSINRISVDLQSSEQG